MILRMNKKGCPSLLWYVLVERMDTLGVSRKYNPSPALARLIILPEL